MVVAAVAAVYSNMHYDYLYSMLMDAKISLARLIYLSFGEKKLMLPSFLHVGTSIPEKNRSFW